MLKLFRNLHPYKMSLLFILVLLFMQSLTELFLPMLMSDIVDKKIVLENILYIWKIGGLLLLVAILGTYFTQKSYRYQGNSYV